MVTIMYVSQKEKRKKRIVSEDWVHCFKNWLFIALFFVVFFTCSPEDFLFLNFQEKGSYMAVKQLGKEKKWVKNVIKRNSHFALVFFQNKKEMHFKLLFFPHFF